MTMGQRILMARQAAGLSQRELAGGEITRNMLSALEHDAANPSVATLRYLAGRLGRPVSYFLGEESTAGLPVLREARAAYQAGEFRRCRELLTPEPEEALAGEWLLLRDLAWLREAEAAVAGDRLPYARELLNRWAPQSPLLGPEWEAKVQLLRARCALPAKLASETSLLLRAEAALGEGKPADGLRYLLALDERDGDWFVLAGRCRYALGQFREAAEAFHRAEHTQDLRRELEDCYRELGDFKMAYYYAKLG